MAKKYFTADWHNGEASLPNTHSFLRPRPTAAMVSEWLRDCNQKIEPEDTFYFLGDLAITLADIDFYKRLPQCWLWAIRSMPTKILPTRSFWIEQKVWIYSMKST